MSSSALAPARLRWSGSAEALAGLLGGLATSASFLRYDESDCVRGVPINVKHIKRTISGQHFASGQRRKRPCSQAGTEQPAKRGTAGNQPPNMFGDDPPPLSIFELQALQADSE